MLFTVMISAQHKVEEMWRMLKIRKLSLSVLWVFLVLLEKVEHLNEQDHTLPATTNCISNLQGKSVHFQVHMNNSV